MSRDEFRLMMARATLDFAKALADAKCYDSAWEFLAAASKLYKDKG